MLLIIILLWILIWIFQRPVIYEKKPNKILILTTTRSGSSFLGEIFNSRSDVFYLFEPLWHLNEIYTEYVKVLKALFNCELVVLRKYLTQNFFFKRNYSKALCKPGKTCIYGLNGDRKYTCDGLKCQPLNLDIASLYCQTFDTVVIKTVRIRNKTQALELMTQFDIKIIHLVRDPRGSFNSKIKTFNRDYNFKQIAKICQDDIDIYETLKDRLGYYLLKYEDLIINPGKELFHLFSFCELMFDEEVLKTIDRLTNTNRSGPYAIGKIKPSGWKTQLSTFKIDMIENACSVNMKLFNFN